MTSPRSRIVARGLMVVAYIAAYVAGVCAGRGELVAAIIVAAMTGSVIVFAWRAVPADPIFPVPLARGDRPPPQSG